MKYKCLSLMVILIFFTLLLTSCKGYVGSYINKGDNIRDNDEKIIKEFRSHHNYTYEELKSLEIKYLGEVDGYRIYFVPYKGTSGTLYNAERWTIGENTFPEESIIRIIGIKGRKLFTLPNLIYETNISVEELYNILPDNYK